MADRGPSFVAVKKILSLLPSDNKRPGLQLPPALGPPPGSGNAVFNSKPIPVICMNVLHAVAVALVGLVLVPVGAARAASDWRSNRDWRSNH